jgi:hypothetical protein
VPPDTPKDDIHGHVAPVERDLHEQFREAVAPPPGGPHASPNWPGKYSEHSREVPSTQKTGAACPRAAAAQCSLACSMDVPTGTCTAGSDLSTPGDAPAHLDVLAKDKNASIPHTQVPFALSNPPGGQERKVTEFLAKIAPSARLGDGCVRAARTRKLVLASQGWLAKKQPGPSTEPLL